MPEAVRRVNARLTAGMHAFHPLHLARTDFTLQHLNIGRALFSKDATSDWHRHNVLQLEYIYSGTFCFREGSHTYRLRAGDVIIIAPNRLHLWRCEQTGAMLGMELAASGPGAAGLLKRMQSRRAPGSLCIRATRATPLMTDLLNESLAEFPSLWSAQRMAATLNLALTQILEPYFRRFVRRSAFKRTQLAQEVVVDKVTRALAFLEANSDRALNPARIAEHVSLSVRHLNRLFKTVRDESVSQAMLRARLERANFLLRSGQAKSAKEAAFATGFSSHSYFTQCFHRQFGRHPREMRQETRLAPPRHLSGK